MSLEEATAHLRAGRPQVASGLLKSRVEQLPQDGDGWFLLGACHHALGEISAAANAFSRAVELNPRNVQAHLGLVAVLRSSGEKKRALSACRDALAHMPGDSKLLHAIALCHEDASDYHAALTYYSAAVEASPEHESAIYNRALLLSRLGRQEEAAVQLASLCATHPESTSYIEAYVDVLLALNRFTEALAVLDRTAAQGVLAAVRRGVALAALRRFDESRKAFGDALHLGKNAVHDYLHRVAPGSPVEYMLSPENIFLERAWSALGICDWSQWDGFVDELRRLSEHNDVAIEPAVAFMSRLAPLEGSVRHAVARHVALPVERSVSALPTMLPAKRPRIRIGVLSPDFREHLNAYLLLPFFELADRARFELIAYSLGPQDESRIRTRIREMADAFQDLNAWSDREAAHRIREDDVDILLDVAGHTTGARFAITAQRPARLQVNYLGFSCSLASPRVDYAIVDRIVGSEDTEWTEARVYLPHTHFLYDFRAEPAPSTVTRRDYGLPDEVFVYCAFHRAEKISPDVFELWMRILAQVPRSVLWFRALSEQTARNLRARAAERGVDPARLVFAPFEPSHDPRYLARHRLGDLMLDSLHHNAMTSACDALGAGLPMLTLRGTALASRAGESLVRAAGLPEMVMNDQEEYVQTAVRLATDRTELQALKQRLAANRRTAPLFDTAGRVRALEAAFQEMYDRMMRGEPPASFDVQA